MTGVSPSLALDPGKTLTQYSHRIWGQEEGLFQPTIYSILQTRDGFLWLGTQDSLIRFDGMHFREFDQADRPVLHGSLIRSLLEDDRGNLWVGSTGSGVAQIRQDGSIKRYTAKDGLPSDSTFCVTSDRNGAIWICTNQGLARFDHDRFRVFTTAEGLPSNQIRSTCQSSNGTQWVAGIDFGLSRWNGFRFETYSDPHISPRDNITALTCSHDGSIWVGTSSGVTQIGAGLSRTIAVRDGLPDNNVWSLAEGSDSSIWIGTDDGISRYRNGEISVYRTRDGLSHSVVLSLYMDREGSLWAGTKDGLDQFTDGKVTPYTTNEGMVSNDVGPVIEDLAGRLWIGTLDRGLNLFDGRRFTALSTNDGLIDNNILSLEVDKNGDLWAGTSKGLNRLSNGRVVATYTRKDGLSGREIHALFVDIQGTLWAGTNKGLDRFDGSKFTNAGGKSGLEQTGIISLSGARTVRLFISTGSPGLFILNNGDLSSYFLDVIHPVDCYYLDHVRHTAWMGTLGSGLLQWQNGRLTHIRVKDGLYDNRIYSILRDDTSNFWLASSKGIFRVSEKELEDFAAGKVRTVTSIPFTTGQLRFECRSGVQPAAWRSHDGRLWFSTTNGLVEIDPNHLRSNGVAPPIRITAIVINGQRVEPSPALHLKPSEKNVEIRYSGLSFISPEKVTFKYLLEGYDRDWTDAGPRRSAFFTNLPPGTFRFEVMARNADGIWSKQPASLNFTIEPRLYQRGWFLAAMSLAIGLVIFAGHRFRIRHLQQRFDLILAERSRIARELHDTLLQGLSGITMQLQALWIKLPASKEKQLLGEIIKDAAMASSQARQSLWGLRTIGPGRRGFAEKLAELARRATAGKPIKLSLRLQPVPAILSPDAEYQLLRIAHEAISNILKHADAGTLEIQLTAYMQGLQLNIADDGIGFDSDAEHQFGHFGLVGIRERAEEIGAMLNVVSSPGAGTKISVCLPLQAATPEANQTAALERQIK